MAEIKIFLVTSDMPDWQKWLVAKEIAYKFIHAPAETQRHLGLQIIIVADNEKAMLLRQEMEHKANMLVPDYSRIQVIIGNLLRQKKNNSQVDNEQEAFWYPITFNLAL